MRNNKRSAERGISLLAMAMMTVLLGLFFAAGSRLYNIWDAQRAVSETGKNIAYVQSALQAYYTEHGRYPCAASLTAAVDAPNFGREVATDCTAAAAAGTFRATGTGGRMVRTGAVPVRDLNIDDQYMMDKYGKRLIYAVTEIYAVDGTPALTDQGAITIVDMSGNDATGVAGNIVEIVYSMGQDRNGAYSTSGLLMQACDTAATSGENCDFNTNAQFVNSVNRSQNAADMFVHTMSYVPHRHILTCEEATAGMERAKHTSFVVDTSGSMAEQSGARCPDSMPGCSRMDAARWALRRAVPAHIYSNNKGAEDGVDPGSTILTGFAKNSSGAMLTNLSAIATQFNSPALVFDNPAESGYVPPDDTQILDDLDAPLAAMCPGGGTPLGLNMLAMANQLRSKIIADIAGGGDPDQFGKIIVLSDGQNTTGLDPLAAATQIYNMRFATPPVEIRVDIIDVIGNESTMRPVAELTGGSYFNTGDSDELLDALYAATGSCGAPTPTAPTDRRACGSGGSWGL